MTDIINKVSKNSGVPSDGMHWLKDIQQSLVTKLDRTTKEKEPIVYEFTQDRALLHQYYRLRDLMYRKVHHLTDFDGSEDVYDKISYILIARRGKLCIGGCRLTIREADEDFLLPMESDEFRLKKIFPDLQLHHHRHAEISRFAILEGQDEREVMHNLSLIISHKTITERARFVFIKSPYLLARNWRLIGNQLIGVKSRICNEVTVPENPLYPEINWNVTLFDASEKLAEESQGFIEGSRDIGITGLHLVH